MSSLNSSTSAASETLQKVQKAMIKNLNTGQEVKCQFNPSDLKITERIRWVSKPDIGGNEPGVIFSGGDSDELEIRLLFDTTHSGQDVRQSYRAILGIANIDEQKKNAKTKKGEPAACRFQWGKFLSFDAVVEKLVQNFIMFKADGTPLRADVTVVFKQIKVTVKGQNPTSRSEPRKIWQVSQGERLDWIAYQEYGDPAYWRHIADSNGLANPGDLYPGQILKLAPLP